MDEYEFWQKVTAFVEREVIQNVSTLISHHFEADSERMMESFSELLGRYDEDGEIIEVYEYWSVSRWFAEKLEAHGEVIEHDFYGLAIWGRTTTGQAIMLDSVVQDIYRELMDL